MKKTCLWLALSLLPTAVANADGLSAEEERIVAHVDEAIGVLEEVVNMNSGMLNAAGVRARGTRGRGRPALGGGGADRGGRSGRRLATSGRTTASLPPERREG